MSKGKVDWDVVREYDNGVVRVFGSQTVSMAKDRIEKDPKNFHIMCGCKKGGGIMLIIKSPYGSLKLLDGKVGEAIEKALSKCGEDNSLASHSNEELDTLLKRSSKALNKAVLKVCSKDYEDLWEDLASESYDSQHDAAAALKKQILKKTKNYFYKEIEKDQQKEWVDLE